jgi:hypothetical protein
MSGSSPQPIVGGGSGKAAVLLVVLVLGFGSSSAHASWVRERVNISPSGNFVTADMGAMSSNGRFVVFRHGRCGGGANGCRIFLRDLDRDVTRSVRNLRRITGLSDTQRHIAMPTISSNGRWVAVSETYTRTRWLGNVARGTWRRLSDWYSGATYAAAFSADSRYLVFRARRCDRLTLGRLHLRSRALTCARPRTRRGRTGFLWNNDVDVSHSGRYAVFLDTRRGATHAYRYDFRTRELVAFTRTGGAPRINDTSSPGITWDGNVALIQELLDTDSYEDFGLYTWNFSERDWTRVDAFPTAAWYYVESDHPAISADGNVVAYRGSSPSQAGIFVRTLPDGVPVQIGGGRDPLQLSTDGMRLLYARARNLWIARDVQERARA